MKLSYIIPVYKVEKYLRQCVDSILAQSMDDYEIILVDDGSPDNCPAICDEYKEEHPDIVKVIHKENAGAACARNTGLKIAEGDYILFIDSDDYLGSDRMKELYDKAVEFDADVIQTTYISVNEEGTEIYNSPMRFEAERIYTRSEMQYEICFSNQKNRIAYSWRDLFKREFLKKNNVYFDESLKMVEDPPFNLLAFLKSERFVAVNIPVYRYRHRNESLQRQKYVEDYDKILETQSNLKIKYYMEHCAPRKEFFEDIGEYSVVTLLPILLNNIYKNDVNGRYAILKRIGNSEMMRRSFMDYDIKKFKSKSLDWWMTWCVKHKLYPIAHFICRKVLYK